MSKIKIPTRLISITMALILLLALLPISALAAEVIYSGSCGAAGNNLTWSLNSDWVLTISGTGAMADYNIQTMPWYNHEENDKIVGLVIGNGVTTIGDYAFYGCDGLTSVTIPDSVLSIGEGAFSDCDSLTSVTIGNGVTSIGSEAFSYCDNLKNLTIGNSVATIGDYAFSACYLKLTSVAIPDSVISIGAHAFFGCNVLTSATVGSGLKDGINAFSSCESLTEVNVALQNPYHRSENGIVFNKEMTELELYPNGKPENSYTIPNGVKKAGFSYCDNLKSVTMPNSVTDISFLFCSEVANITLPAGIEYASFAYCDGLSDITLPSSIYRATFYSCSGLTNVTIQNGVTGVIFNSCDSLTNVALPDSVNDFSFSTCNGLTSVTIPSGVTSLDFGAFDNCSELTSITIPSSVTNIESYAVFGCENLSDVWYNGTEAQWHSIEIDESNEWLTQVNIHFGLPALSIRYGSKTINSGETYQFAPTGGSRSYTWRTGNTAIATVDSSGKVTGRAAGNTYLYCQDSYGSEVKCLLKIVTAPLSIHYTEKSLAVGVSFQFTATGGTGSYNWRTGNNSIATVSSTGKVTGKAAGNTYLYCKDSAGTEVKCLLKVTAAPLSIRYAEKTVTVGVPFQFSVTGGTGGYTWRVGDTAKATVDSSGKVTGKAAGNTYLYCKDSAGTEVKCLLKVVVPPSIRYSEKTINVGASFQFEATGGTGDYAWRVGNAAIATVDTTGKVTGKAVGNTYLYCTDDLGNEVRCLLKITAAPLSIRYAEKTVTVGVPFQFTATGGTGGYTWRVGDTKKATVDSTGKVTGKTAGNTYLYCKDSAGTEVKCLLKVVVPPSIRYSEKTISVGASFQFEASGGSGEYTWQTGNTSVAIVDSTGKVTGKAVGNTYLYCRDELGNEVRCLLKIVDAPLSITYSEKTIRTGETFQFTAIGGSGNCTWRTGSVSTAVVDSTGLVTGKAIGNTYLYCTDSYGAQVRCLLKIVDKPSPGYEPLPAGISFSVSQSDRSFVITLGGITILDSYLTNKGSSIEDDAEYEWGVRMIGDPSDYEVSTMYFAFEPGLEEYRSPEEMQTAIWKHNGAGWYLINEAEASVTHTSDSLTWSFTMPEELDFEFSNVTCYVVRYQEDGVLYQGVFPKS